jgi:hypothetical protein
MCGTLIRALRHISLQLKQLVSQVLFMAIIPLHRVPHSL